MNFEKAFTYPFQDPEWARKLLIPALISLIPIVGQIFILGWSLGVTRRVIQGENQPLPELDFGGQLIEGLKAMVVGLVYSIPIFIFIIPIIIVSVAAGAGNADSIEQSSNILVVLVSSCCGLIIVIYSILIAILMPAAYANMVANNSLSAGLRFREVFDLVRANIGAYLLVLVCVFITGLIAGLGTIACGIGVVVTTAYALSVNGYLYGEAYNEARKNRGFAQVYPINQ